MADIDLVKNDFDNLGPSVGSFKTIAGVIEVEPHSTIILPDGTGKIAPSGGYLVKFVSGEVLFFSIDSFNRFLSL